jgi:hypothetical protein
MPPNALLHYELALFSRSFTDAFSRPRDRLLLGIVLVLGLLWLHATLRGAGASMLPGGREWLALAAAPVSFSWNTTLLRRLAWIGEHGPLAPAAAAPKARGRYLVVAQLPVLIPALLAAVAVGEAVGRVGVAAGAAAVSYAAGLVAAQLWARLRYVRLSTEGRAAHRAGVRIEGRNTAFLVLLRAQLRGGARPVRTAVLLVICSALLTFAACRLAEGQTPAIRYAAAALPSLLLLGATARNDSQLVGFLAFRGRSAGSVALIVSAIPAASLTAAAAASALGGSPELLSMLGLLFLLHLGAALIAVARAWLSPGRNGRRVDLQVQIEAAALLAAALVFLPLAVVLLLGRMWTLRRGYVSSMWLAL